MGCQQGKASAPQALTKNERQKTLLTAVQIPIDIHPSKEYQKGAVIKEHVQDPETHFQRSIEAVEESVQEQKDVDEVAEEQEEQWELARAPTSCTSFSSHTSRVAHRSVTAPVEVRGSPRKKSIPSAALLMVEAMKEGRYAIAYKELLKLESEGGNPSNVLDRSSIERIRRVGKKLIETERVLEMRPSDFKTYEKNQMLGLEWGMRIEGSTMQFVSVHESNADFLKSVVLDSECDLEDHISDDSIQAEEIGERHAHEASWRKKAVNKSMGTKSDDILVANVIDALDEPSNAVLTIKYSISEGDTITPDGAPVPPVEAGHLRTPYLLAVRKMTPIRNPIGDGFGTRTIAVIETRLPPSVAKMLGLMPSFVLRKLARGNAETATKAAMAYLDTSKELEARIEKSPRADFYRHLEQRLVDMLCQTSGYRSNQ